MKFKLILDEVDRESYKDILKDVAGVTFDEDLGEGLGDDFQTLVNFIEYHLNEAYKLGLSGRGNI